MINRRALVGGAIAALPALAIGLSMSRGAEARPEHAEKFVRELIDSAMDILKLPEDAKAEREAGVVRLLDERFDVPLITRLVLGRYWSKATLDQKRRFATVLRIHIVKVYNSQLGLYDNQTVAIRKIAPLNETDTVIFTEIAQEHEQPLRMDWRVRDMDGRFRVVDVAVEGVSMVTTKRSEYRSVLAREGLDSLITRLDALNARYDN